MKYSAEDIHKMRSAVAGIAVFEGMGQSYNQAARDMVVESRLVTYMANGTTVAELEAEIERACAVYRERSALFNAVYDASTRNA